MARPHRYSEDRKKTVEAPRVPRPVPGLEVSSETALALADAAERVGDHKTAEAWVNYALAAEEQEVREKKSAAEKRRAEEREHLLRHARRYGL